MSERSLVEENPLLGESPAFMNALEQVSLVAPLNKPVLVIGERGTGKELVVARLHFLSRRWGNAFIKLNCATLPETLLETELFGHEAGAFTGAQKRRQGRFELADEGTLFLDEVANSSLRVQEKILHVIEYGEFERVGGMKTLQVDVRIIAATNRDLPQMARDHQFREDLLDRLAFDVITLPPLRDRPEDIMLLAEHFAIHMSQELGSELFPGFSARVKQQLMEYPWPGNVRELKNVIERAVYRMQDLDTPLDAIQFDPFASPFRPVEKKRAVTTEAGDTPETPSLPEGPVEFKERVKDYEIALIKKSLADNKFNQRKAADALGLSYHQLRGYLRKYDIK
ncbi:MAG: phage shock protein operon transcriptional activator [Gammaproteobacteria bacterium]|nr:MAG: phage shock protein operon transcriptional activator [Gammaproteobacteria bacterium]